MLRHLSIHLPSFHGMPSIERPPLCRSKTLSEEKFTTTHQSVEKSPRSSRKLFRNLRHKLAHSRSTSTNLPVSPIICNQEESSSPEDQKCTDDNDYVYKAPCERFPCRDQKKYLVNDNIRKLSTELSLIEFGVRLVDCFPVVFKTVPSRQLAEKEIEVLQQVSHIPHVVHIEDSYLDDKGQLVIVLPKLKDLEIGRRNLRDIQRLIRDLLEALEGLHKDGIVHMDLTPANLMVDQEGHLVVIDFGLCSRCSGQPHEPCGTPGYIAPEVYEGNAEGTKPDMYSAGILFGEMLEAYLPDCQLNYLGSNLVRAQTTEMICESLEELLLNREQKLYPEIIYHAADLLKSMLATDPEARPSAIETLKHPFITASEEEFDGTDYDEYTEHLRMVEYNRRMSDTASVDLAASCDSYYEPYDFDYYY
ncbi:kinase-like protein [Basidiobolus meristosporus CBS 931.73]|uniref:Kinase-like protein n=1 Tax=Basidiobolus meristosporus CBS 931.73 TaxID=1314790 RepID=A0A1Y1XU62_9FUNG|nr:kinase-like protein [Basidiobolus meristosporus CBS 931.73]|eukprot:ORX89299.1 kinase-like protein [Basidiobolus meristosporus CBS 931.73]